MDCSFCPWGHKESDMTKQLTLSLFFHFGHRNNSITQAGVLRILTYFLLYGLWCHNNNNNNKKLPRPVSKIFPLCFLPGVLWF